MSTVRGLSAVVPLFNERDNVSRLCAELAPVLDRLDVPTEIILVDDGSSDGTWEQIEKARHEHAGVRTLQLSSNGGQSAALLAGVRHARMSHVATLDGDLQNDPRDLPALLRGLDEADVVIGYRAERRDPVHRYPASWIANAVRRRLLKDGAIDSGCGLKIFPREVFLLVPAFDGMHRFLPALFRMQELSVEQRRVTHRPRQAGRSKYTTLGRLRRTVPDLLGVYWLARRRLGRRVAATGGLDDASARFSDDRPGPPVPGSAGPSGSPD